MLKNLLGDSVLFVGAHVDDIELFAGGILSRAIREGVSPRCLIFSRHRGVHESPDNEVVDSLQGVYGIDAEMVSVFDMMACSPTEPMSLDIPDLMYEIAEEGVGCTSILTHYPGDSNQDHKVVSECCFRVAKTAGKSIFYGNFPFNHTVEPFRPDIIVGLTDADIMRKARALGCYKSQSQDGRKYLSPHSVWCGAEYWGQFAGDGFPLAEPLMVGRIFA